MQSVTININVKSQDIPKLICMDYTKENQFTDYIADMDESLVQALNVEGFLYSPGRVGELRRKLLKDHLSL